MTNKQRYKEFCETHSEVPLFMQSWWFDAVCIPENKQWDVLLYEENGKIVAALPYHLLKKWGFSIIIQPQQTQYSGIWIDYPKNIKLHKRYSFEKKIMDNLIDQLEKLNISYFSQNFHHSFTNWQPFYWKNFKQTTKYTYQIKDLSNLEKVLNDFNYSKRASIINKEQFLVDFSLTSKDFYNFHKRTLRQRNVKIEYSEKLFVSICNTAQNRNQGQIVALRDKNGNLHSAIFLVWDKYSAYNLITSIDFLYKSKTASTKMFWEAIKFVSDKTKMFDFEGSMIEKVALSYQQFGVEQVPYFNISKSYSGIFNLLFKLKQ